MRSAVSRLLVVALLSATPAAHANDLHDQLLRQSLALEQAADGRLASREVDAVVDATSTLLEPLRKPPANFDPLLAAKVHHVRELLGRVRAQRSAGRAPVPQVLPTPRMMLGADAPGSGCTSALSLREGQALRLPVPAGAQVWLRVAAQGDAPLSLTTRGSTLDPTLTAYLDCRVADSEPLAQADDSHGLQAELALVPRKQTFWYVRADNLTGPGEFVLSAVRAVAITGRVTRASTGAALAGVRVALFRNDGTSYSFISSSIADYNGEYALAFGGSGTFAVRTGEGFGSDQGVVHQAYDRLTCAAASPFELYTCGTAGNVATPIVLNDPETRTINFALALGGSVAGTLTSNLGGAVSGATVRIHAPNGAELRSTTTDALGRWRIDGVPNSGIYLTAGAVDHALTLYQGVECSESQFFNCNFSAGTPVSVPNDSFVRVDMTLRRQQFLEVEFTLDGAPLPPDPAFSGFIVTPSLLSATGSPIAQGSLVGGSRYRIGPVAPGSYRLRATSGFAYTRLYPAVDCASDCLAELGAGELVTVAATDSVVSRSMDLRGYPSIDGMVTTEGEGSPITNATVTLTRLSGNNFDTYVTTTNGAGSYLFAAVAQGNWLLSFSSNQHVDEVHDNVPCISQYPAIDCRSGTLISIGATTADQTVNAALARSATIAGRIVSGGQLFDGLFSAIFLVRPDGTIATGWTPSRTADGRYMISDVPTGTWRVGFAADSFSNYIPQLFTGVNCPFGSGGEPFTACPLMQATLVDVATGASITGIDFDLRRTGSHVVRVLNAFDDAPLPGVMIDVWNAAGQRVDSRVTDAEGRAFPTGGPDGGAGPHALSTDNSAGYINEVFQDIECPNGSVFFGTCALTGYSPVVFPAPQDSPQITLRIARPVPIFVGNFEQ